MRKVTNQKMNFRSFGSRLASGASLGVVSILVLAGLTLAPSLSASADTTPIALANAAVGKSYTSSTFTVPTAGTWAVTSGALPSGLGLTSLASATTDTISGTPTADGNFAFTVTVTDAVTPATYIQAYNITVTGIAPASLTSPILINGAYTSSTLIVATAGTWAITAGVLPTGLSLSSMANSTTDTITGTPTVNGSYPFTVTVTDATTPATYSQIYTLVVATQIPQPKLKLLATIAALENPVALITIGGAGINPTTYAVTDGTATGCVISGTTLTATAIGTCIVTASQAASATYLAVTSAAVTFTFVANPLPIPVLTATHVKGTAVIGKTVSLTITGTDFRGRPAITSSNRGTRVAVRSDSGVLLTVRVTASLKAHKGIATFTIKEGNGDTVKIKYVTR
jgi:hypothetical protein